MKIINIKTILSIIAIIILNNSCSKKSLPESELGTPVFMFKGNINNQDISMVAGDSNIYMFTSYFKDLQNIMTLQGTFAKSNCINCEPSLNFEFKDEASNVENKLYGNISSFFERAGFRNYSLDSIYQNLPIETIRFSPDANPPGTTYFWDFGDGTNSNSTAPIHTYTSIGPKIIKQIASYNGFKDSITFAIDFSYFSQCRTSFKVNENITDKSVECSAEGVFNSYYWTFGDGNNASGVNTQHTYSNNGIYEIALNTSKSGCLAIYKKRINFTGNPNRPTANFYYTTIVSSTQSLKPRVNISSCIITYKNDGKEYKSYKTSNYTNQSGTTVFYLENVSPYKNNENNQKTVKIKGKIDLYLYNTTDNNDSIKIKSNQLELGVAYP